MKIKVAYGDLRWESDEIVGERWSAENEIGELAELIEGKEGSLAVELSGASELETAVFDAAMIAYQGSADVDNLEQVFYVMKEIRRYPSKAPLYLYVLGEHCYTSDFDETMSAVGNGDVDEYHGDLRSTAEHTREDAIHSIVVECLEELPEEITDNFNIAQLALDYTPAGLYVYDKMWYAVDRRWSCNR